MTNDRPCTLSHLAALGRIEAHLTTSSIGGRSGLLILDVAAARAFFVQWCDGAELVYAGPVEHRARGVRDESFPVKVEQVVKRDDGSFAIRVSNSKPIAPG